MKQLLAAGAMSLMVAALVPLQGAAHAEDDDRHHELPDRVELPDGWQPEGITTDRRSLFVGSLAGGGIWQANPRTGDGDILEPGVTGRVGVGIDYDRRRDLLWVAGGPTGQVRAHDADTGDVVATYDFAAPDPDKPRFLNDLTVTRRGVFVTDSMYQELMVVPLDRDADMPLPPASAAMTLTLTGDLEFVEGFNLNGIVRFEGKLLAIQSNTGELFRINPRTGDTDEVDLHGKTLVNGDGLERDEDILYVVRNEDHMISVVELDDGDGDPEGRVVANLRSDDFDVPTTVALTRDSLWVVNARFGIEMPEKAEYWVTRIDEFDD